MALNPMQWRLQIETFLNQNMFLLDAITIGIKSARQPDMTLGV